MVQNAVFLSILYCAVVFFLSFVLEKLYIIKKPPLKKGLFTSAFFYIGITLTVLGLYLSGRSKIVGILCCLLGVIIGVLKVSSDSLYARAIPGNHEVKKQEPAANPVSNPELNAVSNVAFNVSNNTIAESPVVEFHEQVILNVITGKGASFVSLYTLFSIIFSFCISLFIFAVIVLVMASLFGKVQSTDITAFFKLIASFDFKNSALRNTSSTQMDALIIAYALFIGIALLILSAVFGAAIRILKSRRITQRVVSALLPGRKRGFVPCSEGVYKLCFHNLLSKNRFYSLYPWESLYLYAIDEKKKRIVLKTGKIQMPLIPWSREVRLFNGLKAVVLGHLPRERQASPVKKAGYRWGWAAAVILVIIILQVVFAGWLDSATGKGTGIEYCDIGGKIHYSFKTAFATEVCYYAMFDDKGKILNRYCELHGIIYVILHPKAYVPTIYSLMQENKPYRFPVRSIMIVDMLTLPAVVWLNLLIMAVYAGKPPRFRYNVL